MHIHKLQKNTKVLVRR